jgi:hypothetical protein
MGINRDNRTKNRMCYFDFTGKPIIHQISQSQIAGILLANKTQKMWFVSGWNCASKCKIGRDYVRRRGAGAAPKNDFNRIYSIEKAPPNGDRLVVDENNVIVGPEPGSPNGG